MIHLLTPPESMMSGTDRFGPETVDGLRKRGFACRRDYLWPSKVADGLCRWFPVGVARRLFKFGGARPQLQRILHSIQAGDIVLINGVAQPADRSAQFENAVKRLGAQYVFYMEDDYFSNPAKGWPEMAQVRVPLADLVLAPTPALVRRIRSVYPAASAVAIEEPVSITRLRPSGSMAPRPRLLWAGNGYAIKDLSVISELLATLRDEFPFVLRVVSGMRRPKPLKLPYPWEWFPFNPGTENMAYTGSWAGLAPLTDSPFARCKGAYKIKAYMAAGVPPIASNIGYQADLITHEANGLLADTAKEWFDGLRSIVSRPNRAASFGRVARETAVSRFSHQVVLSRWAQIFRGQMDGISCESST